MRGAAIPKDVDSMLVNLRDRADMSVPSTTAGPFGVTSVPDTDDDDAADDSGIGLDDEEEEVKTPSSSAKKRKLVTKKATMKKAATSKAPLNKRKRKLVEDVETPAAKRPSLSATPTRPRVVRRQARSKHMMKLRNKRLLRTVLPKCSKIIMKRNNRNIKKVNREDGDDDLKMNLKWSDWKTAMIPRQTRDVKDSWIPRRSGNGARNSNLFKSYTLPAIYECGVQVPSGSITPVVCRVTKGFQNGMWDTKLLNGPAMTNQISSVLRKNCNLMMRRADLSNLEVIPEKTTNGTELETLTQVQSHVLGHYDYAWQQHYDIDTRTYNHRHLTVDSATISQ